MSICGIYWVWFWSILWSSCSFPVRHFCDYEPLSWGLCWPGTRQVPDPARCRFISLPLWCQSLCNSVWFVSGEYVFHQALLLQLLHFNCLWARQQTVKAIRLLQRLIWTSLFFCFREDVASSSTFTLEDSAICLTSEQSTMDVDIDRDDGSVLDVYLVSCFSICDFRLGFTSRPKPCW